MKRYIYIGMSVLLLLLSCRSSEQVISTSRASSIRLASQIESLNFVIRPISFPICPSTSAQVNTKNNNTSSPMSEIGWQIIGKKITQIEDTTQSATNNKTLNEPIKQHPETTHLNSSIRKVITIVLIAIAMAILLKYRSKFRF